MRAILKQTIGIVLTVAVSGALAVRVDMIAAAQATKVAAPSVVIRSPAELALYLKATPHGESPLWLLPPGARKRFLETLAWGSKGLGGFASEDLEQYLTDAQIRRVLALFDAKFYADGLHGRMNPLTTAAREAPETALEWKFDEVYFARADASHDKPQKSVTKLYNRLLAPYQYSRGLAGLNDSDLGLLFRAAGTVASISHQKHYLDDMQIDLAELHRRGIATAEQIVDVHAALVAARGFSQANTLARTYPSAGIKPLPPLQKASHAQDGGPTTLIVVPNGKSLLRKAVDMHASLRIVVVAGCHFSIDAVRAIRSNHELDKLFREHAIWLAGENEPLPAVLDWNRTYPDQSMHVAWRNDEWSMLKSWDIPTFYVFRDGKQIDQWSGWGTHGMSNLVSHLRADGVIH